MSPLELRRRCCVAAAALVLLVWAGCTSEPEVRLPRPTGLDRMEPGVRQGYERLRTALEVRAQSDEERAGALAVLGHWYLLYGDQSVASTAYAAAADLAPGDFRYRYFAGVATAGLGKPAAAQQHLEAALSLAPAHAPLRVHLGEALLDQGKVGEATEELQKAVADPVAEPRARVMLGRVALETGRVGQAIAHLEKARRMAPESRQVGFLLGTAYRRAGRIKEARPLLSAPTSGERRFGDLPEDPLLQNEIARIQSDSKTLARRAQRRMTAGRYLEAAQEYRKALAAAGNEDAGLRSSLVRTLLRAGRLREARQEVERLNATSPGSALTFYSQGALAQAEGRLDRALVDFGRSVDLDPSLLSARDALAELLFRQERWDEALPHYRWLVDHQPTNPSFRVREALTLLLLGRASDATARLGAAGAASGDPRLAYLRVRALASQGNGGEQSADLQRRLLVDTLGQRVRMFESETLAMFHSARGERLEAIFWQEVALASARTLGRRDAIERTESRLRRYRAGVPAGSPVVPGEHSEEPVLPPGSQSGASR